MLLLHVGGERSGFAVIYQLQRNRVTLLALEEVVTADGAVQLHPLEVVKAVDLVFVGLFGDQRGPASIADHTMNDFLHLRAAASIRTGAGKHRERDQASEHSSNLASIGSRCSHGPSFPLSAPRWSRSN